MAAGSKTKLAEARATQIQVLSVGISLVSIAGLLTLLAWFSRDLYRQLGGEPDFSPASLSSRSHADYDQSSDLKDMIRANLIAERVSIECYSQLISLIGDKDSTTRRLLESILSDEQEHADELSDWLAA